MTLLGSGAILTEVVKAAQRLADEGIAATVVSVTSWSELARDGQACEIGRDGGEGGEAGDAKPWLTQVLEGTSGPVIAATDYVRAACPNRCAPMCPRGAATARWARMALAAVTRGPR